MHLVDRDPQAEVAGPEREALLQREDVAADVVDGVGRRAGVVVEHEQVVLAEHALREIPEQDAGLGAGDAAADRARPRLRAIRSPTRAVSGSSKRRIDETLADDPRRAVDDLARRAGPARRRPV